MGTKRALTPNAGETDELLGFNLRRNLRPPQLSSHVAPTTAASARAAATTAAASTSDAAGASASAATSDAAGAAACHATGAASTTTSATAAPFRAAVGLLAR